MIRFENVSKRYKDNIVLSQLSLTIEKGQLVALIGASGCGKTTTLKMINRLVKPSAGKIFLDGTNIAKMDVIRLRRKMGYVIQQTGLFPHMTIRENIELIPKVEKLPAQEIASRTVELMEMVGLDADEFLDRYPSQLSGGQQQRVGVARAFATDPNVILMDEPFSALDPITRIALQDELAILQSKLRKTIVFVTHDMEEAIKIADKICIMHEGKVLQYDTPEEILRNPRNEFVEEFVGKNRIWASPEYIRAADIMIEEPVTCSPELSLRLCMERMRSTKVDSLMVVERKTSRLLGVIRAKDIRKQFDRTLPVAEIMHTGYHTVLPEDNIVELLTTIEEQNLHTIPVVTEDGKLEGLITKSSLVTTLSQAILDSDEGVFS